MSLFQLPRSKTGYWGAAGNRLVSSCFGNKWSYLSIVSKKAENQGEAEIIFLHKTWLCFTHISDSVVFLYSSWGCRSLATHSTSLFLYFCGSVIK